MSYLGDEFRMELSLSEDNILTPCHIILSYSGRWIPYGTHVIWEQHIDLVVNVLLAGFAENVFQLKGLKSSFAVAHVALSYLIPLDLEWKLRWIQVMADLQKHPNCTSQVSNWTVLQKLVWNYTIIYVVVFQHKSPKSFSVAHVALFYSIVLDLEWKLGWLHVMVDLQKHPTCTFHVSNVPVLLNMERN